MKILKFPLEIAGSQLVHMPRCSIILSIQLQRTTVCLWALCDPHEVVALHTIRCYGTGEELPDNHQKHLATIQLPSGLVFHFFEQFD
jgi:hypothetical protein